jgi:hypothetical protein
MFKIDHIASMRHFVSNCIRFIRNLRLSIATRSKINVMRQFLNLRKLTAKEI